MKLELAYLLLNSCFAAGAEHGHGFDAETKMRVIYQFINVSIIVGAGIYYLKPKVVQFFKDRQANFVEAANKAMDLRKQAEDDHMQIKVRLNKLESTSDESIQRANAEAADFRNQLLKEAEELSKKIKLEAEQAAKLEIEKAKISIRQQMIEEAVALSSKQIESQITQEDHKKLEGEFINNMRAVQS